MVPEPEKFGTKNKYWYHYNKEIRELSHSESERKPSFVFLAWSVLIKVHRIYSLFDAVNTRLINPEILKSSQAAKYVLFWIFITFFINLNLTFYILVCSQF